MNEHAKITGVVQTWLRDAKTGNLKRYKKYTNLIVDSAKVAIAARLAGDVSVANRGEITFGSVGLDATSPVPSNVALGNEFFRKALSFLGFVDNVATLRMFMTTAEGNGLLKEFGLFGEDASGVADSGTMFNHVNIDENKTVAETLTIEAQITIG